MKKSLSSLLALGILILATSCEKECGFVNISGIRGEWEWIESIGGIAGTTITPAILMATKSLKISGSYYEEFLNDSLIFRSKYEIVITPDSSWGTNVFLEFETGSSFALIQQGTSLTFNELCFDCFTHIYERK